MATLNEPSPHFSPAAITAILFPICIAWLATATAFLNDPQRVGVEPVDRDKLELFGEGKTSLVLAEMFSNEVGESEYPFANFLLKTSVHYPT